jgi:hypothetical protein
MAQQLRRKELCRKYFNQLNALDMKFSTEQLNELVSRQNQSPDNPVIYWCNLNYLTREETIALVFVAWLSNSKTIKSLILSELFSRMQKQQGFSMDEKANLLRFLSDHVKRGLPFYKSHQKVFLSYFPRRQVLGILGDPKVWKSLQRRLRPRLVFPAKPRRQQRHRGYRDHGTCRPDSKWLPKDIISPRRLFEAEELQKLQASWFQRCLTEPYWNWFWPKTGRRMLS